MLIGWLIGKNPEIGVQEVRSLGKLYERDHRILLFDVQEYARLAYFHEVSEFVAKFSGTIEEIIEFSKSIEWRKIIKGSFKTRIVSPFKHNRELNLKFAATVYDSLKNPKVDLTNPDYALTLYLVRSGKRFNAYFGILKYVMPSYYFDSRNKNLFVSSSTILEARLARALVNLVGCNDDILLDPFCGASGILMEAAKVTNATIYGIDFSIEALAKSAMNLSYFKIRNKVKLYHGNSKHLHEFVKKYHVNKMVTDFPYGLQSKIDGKLAQLLKIFLSVDVDKAFIIPKRKDLLDLLPHCDFQTEVYVNKNLTRVICLIKKR